ncbi:response regulator [Arthrobacter mobilis]|uniref:Transcriptional regulatory protein n=1 Tax=Arthrobacter mobilis TaxID=2724944 RepID=A0A7X6HFB9_9MICC|nr:response regulator [Arthrobacter mobilis]NKX54981.1 response regulator [Arthrobacter mobilis]
MTAHSSDSRQRPVRVLVVDDEPVAAQAHAAYLQRLDGFALAGTAGDGQGALRAVRDAAAAGRPIDLILLDMNLPDLHGLDVSQRLRTAGLTVDIIAITAARDLQIIRGAVSAGIVQYLIKPFTFATFAEKLAGYLDFRHRLEDQQAQASQRGVDLAFASLRAPADLPLPKGLSASTLAAVTEFVRDAPAAVSAAEVMEALGISRVTARRYLEHLADAGRLERSARYGTPGRPENEYRWR